MTYPPEPASGIISSLRGSLIASCQPVRGGVFDEPQLVALFARAAIAGGCVGLRVESLADLQAVRAVTDLPIVGLIKRESAGERLFITPSLQDVQDLPPGRPARTSSLRRCRVTRLIPRPVRNPTLRCWTLCMLWARA